MAEGARLESVFTGNRNVGSNPTPSATFPSEKNVSVCTISAIELCTLERGSLLKSVSTYPKQLSC